MRSIICPTSHVHVDFEKYAASFTSIETDVLSSFLCILLDRIIGKISFCFLSYFRARTG